MRTQRGTHTYLSYNSKNACSSRESVLQDRGVKQFSPYCWWLCNLHNHLFLYVNVWSLKRVAFLFIQLQDWELVWVFKSGEDSFTFIFSFSLNS